MKKKLLVFDLDGTLMNTLKDLNVATNFALKKYNYEPRTLEQTRKDIGNGVAMLIARSIPNGMDNPNYPECLTNFKTYYKAHYFENTFPYEKVKETLTILKSKGYLLAVVSNKFDEGAKKLVNYYLPNIFDRIQGSLPELGLGYKPSPDLVNKVLSEFNINNKDALYIGDTEVDYQTAVNSNLDVVMVSYGYRDRSFLETIIKNSPIIDCIDELINLLD